MRSILDEAERVMKTADCRSVRRVADVKGENSDPSGKREAQPKGEVVSLRRSRRRGNYSKFPNLSISPSTLPSYWLKQ